MGHSRPGRGEQHVPACRLCPRKRKKNRVLASAALPLRVDGVARRVIQAPKPAPRIMRYELTDFEWAAIKPFLPNKPRGVPRVNDRRVLNGIFWVLRSGAPWRDLPDNFGPYTTCYNRFVRWRRAVLVVTRLSIMLTIAAVLAGAAPAPASAQQQARPWTRATAIETHLRSPARPRSADIGGETVQRSLAR